MELEFLPIIEERGLANLHGDKITYFLGSIYQAVILNNRFHVLTVMDTVENAIEELTFMNLFMI